MVAALTTLLPLAQAGGFVREPGQGATSCVGRNDTICFDYIWDHLGDYVSPTLEHLAIVLASVAIGFVIAFGLVVISHRRRWLIPAFTGITGVIYTIPSIALFLLLLPITGRGNVTAVVALCLYTLQIIYRNIVIGLANVPASTKDAGRGMGMTEQQLFRRVELPLAVPEIIAGVRIATVSTVAIASLAVFAGGGGLGSEIVTGSNITFHTGVVTASTLLIGMAIAFDVVLLLVQRRLTRWRSAGEGRGARRTDLLRTLSRRAHRMG